MTEALRPLSLVSGLVEDAHRTWEQLVAENQMLRQQLYRENIALKAQLDTLEARLRSEEAEVRPKPKRPLRERAAQVFA